MNNTQAVRILTEEKARESDARKVNAFALGIEALDKIKKLEQLTNLFEKTFDWWCNDTARDLYANAVYAVVSGNEIFKECVEQFEEHVLENL